VPRLVATYHVRSDARAIESRARAIAVEQSVEMPLAAIEDQDILDDIVGRVEDIGAVSPGVFAVRIGLSRATAGDDAGQLIKPQGLSPARLAELAARFARGGIDYIKDDHGLADQTYSPFAARCAAVAKTLRAVAHETGKHTRYVASLTGDLDALRNQIMAAKDNGIDTVMVQPMIMGLSNFVKLKRENPDMAFFAHPTLAGAARIAPPLLFGKIFRMLGADALVFPNHGGRFGYTPDTCREIARAGLADRHRTKAAVPVPAGGMTVRRVGEMLDFYGADVMLLIGGALLEARERLTEETAAFVVEVKRYRYG